MTRAPHLAAAVALALPWLWQPQLHAADNARPLVLVIDQSASMHRTDPRRYAADAVNLTVATVRTDAPLLVVGFDSSARDLVPWQRLAGRTQRVAVRESLKDLEFDGNDTFYIPALDRVFQELDRNGSPKGTSVIFFTDGDPDETERAILERADRFLARGWTVRAMRLNRERTASRPVLASLAQRTRGTHVEITQAEELVTRFLALVMSENDSFISTLQQSEAGQAQYVPPGVSNVAWVVVRGEDRCTLRGINSEAGAVSEDVLFRYPRESGTRSANLECATIERPSPGSYTLDLKGTPGKIFVGLTFAARIEVLRLPAEVVEGEPLSPGVEFVFSAEDAKVAQELAGKVEVHAVITDTIGGKALYDAALPPAEGAPLRFTKLLRLRLPEGGDRSQNHPLAIEYRLRLKGGYQLDKVDATVLKPREVPPPLALSAREPALELPPTWVGRPVSGTLTMSVSGPPAIRQVTFPEGKGFRFPSPLPVPAKDAALKVEAVAAEAGVFRAQVEGKPDGKLEEGEAAPTTPPLSVTVYGWQGRDELVLDGPNAAGVQGWIQVPENSLPQPLKPVDVELKGAGGRSVRLGLGTDGAASVQAGDDVPAGDFAGAAELAYGTLPVRPLRITYKHRPADARLDGIPAELALKPAAWAERERQSLRFPVTLGAGAAGTLAVTVGDLTGPDGEVLDSKRDLTVRLDRSDLAAGATGNVEVAVLRGHDIPAGTYRGKAEIVFTARNGAVSRIPREIVVVVP
ncbi:MAG: VWA domain-containing protein [Planctomycetes bacterium]|nr:VWA domain-containing protein [Planctomycetota bacterium]